MAKKTKSTKPEKEQDVIDDVLNDDEDVSTSTELKEVDDNSEAKDVEKTLDETTDSKSKDEEQLVEVKKDAETDVKTETKPETEPVTTTSETKPEEESSAPPPRPKRPLTPKQEAFKNLKDAFPTIEDKYITGVLIASKYNLESAFNALLYISDPETVKPEDLIPADQQVTLQSSEPVEHTRSKRELTQLEQDELLARQLNETYNKRERRRARQREDPERAARHSGDGRERLNYDEEDDDVFTNFVEKDLPQIKEQFTKNIEETKTKFTNWVSGWKQQYQQSSNNLNNRRTQPRFNQRGDYEFDDEPEEVDLQKFHGISLNNNTGSEKTKSGFNYNDDDDQDSSSKPKLPNRNRAGSTDIYGTPKSTKKWESLKGSKPEPISKAPTATTSTSNTVVDDDDFLLSDDDTKK